MQKPSRLQSCIKSCECDSFVTVTYPRPELALRSIRHLLRTSTLFIAAKLLRHVCTTINTFCCATTTAQSFYGSRDHQTAVLFKEASFLAGINYRSLFYHLGTCTDHHDLQVTLDCSQQHTLSTLSGTLPQRTLRIEQAQRVKNSGSH